MSFSTVTWANKDVPALAKFVQMQANTDHLLAELHAVNVATFGYLSEIAKYNATTAVGIKVDSTVVGTLATVALTATDYSILNRDVGGLAVGQHTLYFNNVVAKLWKPEGLNYMSAWFRAKAPLTGGLYIDFVTVMMHRAAL